MFGRVRVLLAMTPLVAAALGAPASAATAGDLDPSWGTGGAVTADFGGADFLYGMVVDDSGRVVGVGSSNGDFAVARWLPDGTPDAAFGTGGRIRIDLTDGDTASSVALLPGGALLVGGQTSVRGQVPRVTFLRLLPNGSRDSTFGTHGVVVTTVPWSAYRTIVNPDGTILVGGSGLVARFLPDGSRDASFGVNGVVEHPGGGQHVVARQDDGAIVVGRTRNTPLMEVTRLNRAGQVDPTFGDGGVTTISYGSGTSSVLRDLIVQPDGRIVVSGDANLTVSNTDFALARLDGAGRLDPSFGNGGRVNTHFGVGDFGYGLAIQQDGKLVVTGTTAGRFTGSADIAVARYLTDGSLDNGFGTGGKVVTHLGRLEFPQQVLLQRDGRMLVGGFATSSNGFNDSDFQVVRYVASADVVPPVVRGVPDRAPDSAPWYVAPVGVDWVATDDSGVASDPPATVANLEGEHRYVSGPSCDPSGNCSTGEVTLSIDLGDPTVTCPTAAFTLRQPDATITATVADTVSGPAAPAVTMPVDTSTVGTHTIAITGADKAGRTKTVACAYTVTYGFAGFFEPVRNAPDVNHASAGRTVPLKWRLTSHAGAAVDDASSFAGLASTTESCRNAGAAVEAGHGASGARYLGDGYWTFEWATSKAYAGQRRELCLHLADGTVHGATFHFRD